MVELKVTKSADRSYVFLGISNRIKYSIVITNIGDEKATGIKIRDINSKGAYFILGTFMINGCNYDIINIDEDISIGSINPGANTLISFDVEITKCNPPTEIRNKAIVSYCNSDHKKVIVESEEVIIPVVNINTYIKKMVDKSTTRIGEILSYSLIIRNTSNINIDNVIFYDYLPTSVELLPASVLVNLEPQYVENLSGGIGLGTINPYSSVVVSFQVKVVSLPEPALIKNTGKIEFSYTILDNGISITSLGEGCSNQVITRVINDGWVC